MKVEWNKVTPLSKLVALALFVALPFIGFYYGIKYGVLLQTLQTQQPQTMVAQQDDYYQNISEWQMNRHDDAGFSVMYPIDFSDDDNHALTPSTDGVKVLEINIPKAFEPHTNFAEAKVTIGYSRNSIAFSQCLKPSQGETAVPAATTDMNGTHFVVFNSTGAGAGNYYETKSYRTIHNDACWAIEYTIHSAQIANYPAGYQLHEFNAARVRDLLDRVVSTFRFL